MTALARNVSALSSALQASETLLRLAERLQESRLRLEAIRPLLPAELAAHVQSGPLDADGWTLLAASPAVAAKLRQLVPRLRTLLTEGKFTDIQIRVKVLPL
ncbi:MAG: hypothetical protein U1E89_03945 [Burkholderiaceae bacterium]